MIWDDPWIAIATQSSVADTGFCTTLPPPRPVLTGQFICTGAADLSEDWLELVGTRWTLPESRGRLEDAWIPRLYTEEGDLVATCVLRPRGPLWILETLRARRGFGAPLMRATMSWIWDRAGPFHLGFTWELTGAQLIAAWWRGWLAAAVSIGYGWVFSEGCGFCSKTADPLRKLQHPLPLYIADSSGAVIINDSGAGDGWGHVVCWTGSPNWTAVRQKGGWDRLWAHGPKAPGSDWSWTGEFVVVGVLNWNRQTPLELPWRTAEI
jgi:hypothetical protein